MKCRSSQRPILKKGRGILLTITVFILGCVFFFIGVDHSLDPDGPTWQVSDVPNSQTFDHTVIQNLLTLLQNKLKDLQNSQMLQYAGKQVTCTTVEDKHVPCTDPNCSDTLVPQLSPQNIQSIMKPVARVGREKLRRARDAFDVKAESKKYIFLTAASFNHFHESKKAIESLQKNVLPHISNYSLIYYDLGLSNTQRNYVKSASKFELKSFPFDKLPNRVQYLKCYVWKPLIISAYLPNCDIVVWMDSSIRYLKDMTEPFLQVSKTGVLISSNGFQFSQHVILNMFSYFGDQPCHYSKYQEFDANFIVFQNEPFVRQLVVEPWVACALDPACMCPDESRNLLFCPIEERRYGKCHRYDQATIVLILHKLFRDAVQSVVPGGTFKTVERAEWYEAGILYPVLGLLGIN